MKILIFSLLLIVFGISLISALEIGTATGIGVGGSQGVVLIPPTNGTFLELDDTPNTYTGQAGKCVIVNGVETELEFGACGTGSSSGGGNTTTEMRNAINNSGFYNITSNISTYWNGSTGMNTTQFTVNLGIFTLDLTWLTTFINTLVGATYSSHSNLISNISNVNSNFTRIEGNINANVSVWSSTTNSSYLPMNLTVAKSGFINVTGNIITQGNVSINNGSKYCMTNNCCAFTFFNTSDSSVTTVNGC